MAVEVCMLVGEGGVVLWADRSSDPFALPDSRGRWQAIWRHRDELVTIAHSHPRGPLAFSGVDRSTMAAVDIALGEPQRYAVVSPTGTLWSSEGRTWDESEEPWWTALLRWASGMPERMTLGEES